MTEPHPSNVDLAVEIVGIEKRYGGVHALRGVDFQLKRGEIHALMGQNGAGKSTVIRILAGAEHPNTGTIKIFGEEKTFRSPANAAAAGISVVYQDLSLVPGMTVADNLFLGREPIGLGWKVQASEILKKSTALLESYGFKIDPKSLVEDLPFAYKQMTEIAKALLSDAKILILDEPTSALTDGEEDILFAAIQNVVGRGVSVIYVTHRLNEVFRICERVTVFRDGRNANTFNVSDLDMKTLVSSIIGPKAGKEGADLGQSARSNGANAAKFKDHPPAIVMKGVSNKKISNVSLTVNAGEIIGLAGALGSGRTEIVETIFGIHGLAAGTMQVAGKDCKFRSPADAISAGIGLVPEDRHEEGLVLSHAIEMNIALPSLKRLSRLGLFLRSKSEDRARSAMSELSVKAASSKTVLDTLSGGNQQKVVFGKWSEPRCNILLLDEPTIGVDISARGEIYQEIRKAAEQGTAVIVISSDFAELMLLCDRYLIVENGTVTRSIGAGEIKTEEDLHQRVHTSISENAE